MDQLPPPPPPLEGLTEDTWTPEEGAAYQAAIGMIDKVLGLYSRLIEVEQSRPSPDEDRIRRYRAGRSETVTARRSLPVTDTEAVAAAIAHYSQLASQLSREAGGGAA